MNTIHRIHHLARLLAAGAGALLVLAAASPAMAATTRVPHYPPTAPAAQASKHCGPPIALITRGITTNGPTPTISIMFSATASFKPSPRSSPPRCSGGVTPTPLGSPFCCDVIAPPRIAKARHAA